MNRTFTILGSLALCAALVSPFGAALANCDSAVLPGSSVQVVVTGAGHLVV